MTSLLFRFRTAAIAVLLVCQLAAAPGADEPIYDLSQVKVPPGFRKSIELVYPAALGADGVEGIAIVDMIVDSEGRTSDVHCIAASDPRFAESAENAWRKMQFEPARLQGKPVAVRYRHKQEFNTRGSKRPLRFRVADGAKPKPPLPIEWSFLLFEGSMPRLSNHLTTIYPFEALVAEKPGKVRLQFWIGADDRATDITVLEATAPEFATAASSRLGGIWFQSVLKDALPRRGPYTVEFDFKPNGAGDTDLSKSALALLRTLRTHPEQIASGGYDAPPQPLRTLLPGFPVGDLAEGQAEIEVIVDQNGCAQLPRAISCTTPEFGAYAAQAAALWIFAPLKIDGKTVTGRVRLPFTFKRPPAPKPGASALDRLMGTGAGATSP